MAFDAAIERIVLHHARNTWLFDTVAATWTDVTTPTAPPLRTHFGMAYDTGQERTVLHGGRTPAYVLLNDTWLFDGRRAVWGQVTTAQAPPVRDGHRLVYDPRAGRIVLVDDYQLEAWVLVPAAAPRAASLGSGCGGAAGVPALTALTPPALGSTFTMQLAQLPPQAGLWYLGVGLQYHAWAGVPLPIEVTPDCFLQIAPEPSLSVLLPHGGTTTSLSIAIPNHPSLAGLRIAVQAAVADATAANGSASLSNAMVVTIH
jgi:hypothetical protein